MYVMAIPTLLKTLSHETLLHHPYWEFEILLNTASMPVMKLF